MGILRYKDGVTLKPDAAGGRLHGAIERVARTWPSDIVITAGADSHGLTDPHTLGRAFDIRTHDMTDPQKVALIDLVLRDLAGERDQPVEQHIDGIYHAANTKLWFGQVENHWQPTEHIHLQLRNGAVFPPHA